MNAALFLIFPSLIILLLSLVLLFRPEPEGRDSVETVSGWSMGGESVRLPQSFSRLSSHTPLTLTTQIQPQSGDYLYIKTVYTPIKLYVDGRLIFRYGQDGDFPAFQILSRLFSEMGFSLFFSVALLILGLILTLISLVLTRFEKSGIAFFWLGLFSLCTGGWMFVECNLTGLLIGSPPFLYLLAFLGLFTLAIPLLRFGLTMLQPHTDAA